MTKLYDGILQLPGFVPEQATPPAVAGLLSAITEADAVVFSTPEYAGGLPGVLKNLLDWTVGGGELYGKPVAWLDVANPGRGEGARAQLVTVLGYVGAMIVEPACRHIALDRVDGERALGSAGERTLEAALGALAAHVSTQPAS